MATHDQAANDNAPAETAALNEEDVTSNATTVEPAEGDFILSGRLVSE